MDGIEELNMKKCDKLIKLARQRSSQESLNGDVKGGIAAVHILESFCILEGKNE